MTVLSTNPALQIRNGSADSCLIIYLLQVLWTEPKQVTNYDAYVSDIVYGVSCIDRLHDLGLAVCLIRCIRYSGGNERPRQWFLDLDP